MEQVQKSFTNMDVGMHPCEKSWKQGNPLSNTIKDTSTIMHNPSLHSLDKGLRMIVLISLIVLLRGFPCFHDFSHGASLHPYSFIFALVYIYNIVCNASAHAHTCLRSGPRAYYATILYSYNYSCSRSSTLHVLRLAS